MLPSGTREPAGLFANSEQNLSAPGDDFGLAGRFDHGIQRKGFAEVRGEGARPD